MSERNTVSIELINSFMTRYIESVITDIDEQGRTKEYYHSVSAKNIPIRFNLFENIRVSKKEEK